MHRAVTDKERAMTTMKQGNAGTRFTATRNACKLCAPLGASLVFRGIENAVPLLHGSQGCATYIRRYLISHFREPVDIASSNFVEETTIFGGAENLRVAVENVCTQYGPSLIGIATTCLSETIGENVPLILQEIQKKNAVPSGTAVVSVSTPSYSGTHLDGFHRAVHAVVDQCAESGPVVRDIAVFPGFVSPADLRYLRTLIADFGHPALMLPDYSDTLDSGLWAEYHRISPGGTTLAEIKKLGRAFVALQFSSVLTEKESACTVLRERFSVPYFTLPLPVGIGLTDQLISTLEAVTGTRCPAQYEKERARLADAYADGHKYIFGKRAAIYGEEDLVIPVARFLCEIGMVPALCASGGKTGALRHDLLALAKEYGITMTIREGVDFEDIYDEIRGIDADIMIGNSKGYAIARRLALPLVRIGFPIHDRFGGARLRHIGYAGTQELFDRIVNVFLEEKQEEDNRGFSYL